MTALFTLHPHSIIVFAFAKAHTYIYVSKLLGIFRGIFPLRCVEFNKSKCYINMCTLKQCRAVGRLRSTENMHLSNCKCSILSICSAFWPQTAAHWPCIGCENADWLNYHSIACSPSQSVSLGQCIRCNDNTSLMGPVWPHHIFDTINQQPKAIKRKSENCHSYWRDIWVIQKNENIAYYIFTNEFNLLTETGRSAFCIRSTCFAATSI